MKIVVGSTNPVKVGAVESAIKGRLKATVYGQEIASKVSNQPMSDEETKNGSFERAMGSLEYGDVGVGLEGGVYVEDGRMWNTVWCCAVEKNKKPVFVNGSRFILPEKLSREILRGKEMGPVMDILTGKKDVKKKEGMLGTITGGWMTRKMAYESLVRIALGRLFTSRDWA